MKHHPSRAGLTQDSKAGPVWTGEVRLSESQLVQPLRWKRPRRIFWNAHGDLFHENVPDEWIDRVFAVCALTPQHTHMILTKRPERMRQYVVGDYSIWRDRVSMVINDWPADQIFCGNEFSADFDVLMADNRPLPNVWLGVSVEDQTRADERIPDLLATPAAVRFLSCEPLLGAVDIRPWIPTCYECGATCGLRLPLRPDIERCTECGEECGPDTEPVVSEGCPHCSGELEPVCPGCGHYMVYQHPDTPNLGLVIVGCESGPGARIMLNEWAQSLVDQCKSAGVAAFVKQLSSGGPKAIKDIEQFPEGLQIREFPA